MTFVTFVCETKERVKNLVWGVGPIREGDTSFLKRSSAPRKYKLFLSVAAGIGIDKITKWILYCMSYQGSPAVS